MDKTILSYEAARSELTRYVDPPLDGPDFVVSPLLRALDHLETAVDSLWRVATFTERLRRDQLAPAISPDRIPPDAAQQRLRKMRNAIQHADADVIQGRVRGMQLVCDDRIEFGLHTIHYAELASWIEHYHDVARELIAYLPHASEAD